MINYKLNPTLTANDFIALLNASALGERRPVDDPDTIEQMVTNANLTITAHDSDEDDKLIGVSRSVTDFGYCCYLSDLAVDSSYQGKGLGRELIKRTRDQLGQKCMLILLSAPAAIDYYPRIGFTRHDSAWILKAGEKLL